MTPANAIGTLGESALHAALKQHIARPGDQLEIGLDGYIIDILRPGQIIEIQTRNLAAIRPKIAALLPRYPVNLIHPLARLKWIQRIDADGTARPRRRSPKQACIEDAFRELLRIADLLPDPNLTVTLLFIEMEEDWTDDGQGSWRRRHWSITARRLIHVMDEHRLSGLSDYLALLPPGLAAPFTNAQLAAALRIPTSLAGKMTWTLRTAGALSHAGKQGRSNLFSVS
ncbi:MAG: hypothetical protein EPO32_13965 [Anaerolineae bacterium]|nr:MAG: hypothetical protein EPO32_13965 [Anaerolineae bacterium]